MGTEVRLSWVPADDGIGIDASLARELNERADRTAGEPLSATIATWGATERTSRLQAAKRWTRAAFDWAAKIDEAYNAYLASGFAEDAHDGQGRDDEALRG